MSNDLLSKGLSLVRGWFEPPPEKVLERIRDELRECADLIGGEVSARQLADELYPRIRGKLVPADTFDEVVRHLESYRAGKGR